MDPRVPSPGLTFRPFELEFQCLGFCLFCFACLRKHSFLSSQPPTSQPKCPFSTQPSPKWKQVIQPSCSSDHPGPAPPPWPGPSHPPRGWAWLTHCCISHEAPNTHSSRGTYKDSKATSVSPMTFQKEEIKTVK